MRRRDFLRAAALSPVAASLARFGLADVSSGQRPNILFIMADDHASHAMSCYGSRINRTPNLDRIAAEGMRFDNCFCTNSICAPSRAVILTGKYSHLNGVRDNRLTFDGSQQTFPKVFQRHGYETAMIGKWHLKSDPAGFDYWNVLPGQGAYHDPVFIEHGEKTKHTGYVTDLTTDFTLDWLREGRDESRPFMLMCHHKAPHRRWEPDERHAAMYADETVPEPATLNDNYVTRSDAAREQEMTVLHHLTRHDLKNVDPPEGLTEQQLKEWKYQAYIKDYLRCIASVDDNIGRLLTHLDESGLADNTLVVYTSDQGFYLGDHGWFDKRFMYEESLRSPLVMRLPGTIRPGSVNDDIVLNLDFGPTFLDIAGADVPADMQGEPFTGMLRGRTPEGWRESMYYHYYEYPAVHAVKRHYGVRTKRHKLIHFYYDIDAWELYDLEKDPNELNNVYADPTYGGVVAELRAELTRLQKQYGDDTYKEVIGMTHPDFDRIRLARVADSDFGYAVSSDGNGYALQKTDGPLKKRIRLTCSLKTLRGEGTRNGLVCFGPDDKPENLMKCGVYIGAGEAIIQHGAFGGAEDTILRHPFPLDRGKTFGLEIRADLEEKMVTLIVDGETILTTKIDKPWSEINYVGYAVNFTETAFSRLVVEGE